MATPECPPDQALRNYLLGDCSDAISEEIEGHLAHCPTCEATLAQFDSADDTLMRHLPLAAAAGAAGAEPPPGWIDVLRQQPPPDGLSGRADAHPEQESRPVASGDAPRLPDGFANYELLGVIGRGGMGVVFLARHRQLNRRVALKVVRPEALSSAEARRRFQREIQILGGLNHPGIVMATDAGTVGGSAYLVMELIDGADLGRIVREGGPLTIEAACEAGRQIAEALAAAHASGAVHRDVKPSNTMVDHTGRVRLLDFGLAHTTRLMHESGETSVGRLLGTLDYMAPEQTDDQRPVDARADLYGLGATLFFLLTGRPPHGTRAGRSILDHLRAVSHDDAPPVSSLRVDVPLELNDLIARMLNRAPSSRPQSAADVAAALAQWAGGSLSARVAELKSHPPIPDSESEDSAAARQSLAELLGSDGSRRSAVEAVATPAAMAVTSARRKRLWWWTSMASLVGIVLAGVTIWLKTPQGTFKIESESGDVTVEVLDERDQVRALKIKEGKNETILDAGIYRVRLAGVHDGLELDRDMFTLRRGDVTMATITRVAATEKQTMTRSTGEPNASIDVAERLYQGKSESVWLRLFTAETEPVAKLDAAKALLALAADLAPARQLERILDVGEEVVRASFGEAPLEFAFDYALSPPARARRWDLRQQPGPVYKAYYDFQQQMNNQVQKLPGDDLAQGLCLALLKGSEPRAAFAGSLLSYVVTSQIGSAPAAIPIVLTTLDVPLKEMDRSAVCLLVRARYARKAAGEQRRTILDGLQQLAVQVRDAPAGGLRDQMREALLQVARTLSGPDMSPDSGRTIAYIILNEIIEKPNAVDRLFLFGTGGTRRPPYGREYVVANREQLDFFLDAWLSVANAYLEDHRDKPADPKFRAVVYSLDIVLRLYSDGDDWPVGKTAMLLTDVLRAQYADASDTTLDPSGGAGGFPMPASLLTQIVRITGEIPELVRVGHPRPAAVVQKLKKFEIRLNNETESPLFEEGFDVFMGLIDEAPYEAVKFCVAENKLPRKTPINVRGDNFAAATEVLLDALARPKPGFGLQNPESPADPLLLLAILADLTGETEAQDARIATLFKGGGWTGRFREHLQDLLSGSLKARPITVQLLEKMAARSKSGKLTQAVRELLPDKK